MILNIKYQYEFDLFELNRIDFNIVYFSVSALIWIQFFFSFTYDFSFCIAFQLYVDLSMIILIIHRFFSRARTRLQFVRDNWTTTKNLTCTIHIEFDEAQTYCCLPSGANNVFYLFFSLLSVVRIVSCVFPICISIVHSPVYTECLY